MHPALVISSLGNGYAGAPDVRRQEVWRPLARTADAFSHHEEISGGQCKVRRDRGELRGAAGGVADSVQYVVEQEFVAADASCEDVVSGCSREQVVAGTADQPVVAAAAVDDVIAGIALDELGKLVAVEVDSGRAGGIARVELLD